MFLSRLFVSISLLMCRSIMMDWRLSRREQLPDGMECCHRVGTGYSQIIGIAEHVKRACDLDHLMGSFHQRAESEGKGYLRPPCST